MAQIYRAPSKNQQAVEAVLKPETQRIWLRHEKLVKDSPGQVRKWMGVVVGCVVAALALIFWPGLLKGIQETIEAWVLGLRDLCWSYDIDPEIRDMDPIQWLFHFAIAGPIGLVCAVVGFVLQLISGIVPLLVTVLLFLVIGAVAMFAWSQKASIEDEVANFTYEDAQSQAIQNLPDDLQRLQAGLEGEERALKMASFLPDDASVFANLEVPVDGEKSKTDLIVVSPSGVTVVEVRNLSGTVTGDLSDEKLIRRKLSQAGNAYDSQVENPVRQAEGHCRRLADYLRGCGADAEIHRCVLFVHESAELQLTDRQGLSRKCPVFSGRDEGLFLAHLYAVVRHPLSAKRIEQITQALRKLL